MLQYFVKDAQIVTKLVWGVVPPYERPNDLRIDKTVEQRKVHTL